MSVELSHATSDDGTEVPYFLVRGAGTVAGTPAPTVMYGYGGFEIPMLPGYGATTGYAFVIERLQLRLDLHPRRRRIRPGVAPRGEEVQTLARVRGLFLRREGPVPEKRDDGERARVRRRQATAVYSPAR
jgi:hypothetical protein